MPPIAQASFDPSLLDADITPRGALRRAIWACIIGGIGAIFIASILTYSPFDPTGDTAGLTGEMHNFLGAPGASLANVLLQFLGWAALPLGLLMMFAAARAVLKPRANVTRWDTLRRSSLLVFSAVFLSMFLAAFPLPQSWPMATGLGGYFGDSLFLGLKSVFTAIKINPSVAGGVSAFLVFCALGYSFGRFIGMVGRDVAQVFDAAGLLWSALRVRLDQLVRFLRTKFQKSYIDPLETAGYDDRRVWAETPGAAPAPAPHYEPAPVPAPTPLMPKPRPPLRPNQPLPANARPNPKCQNITSRKTENLCCQKSTCLNSRRRAWPSPTQALCKNPPKSWAKC